MSTGALGRITAEGRASTGARRVAWCFAPAHVPERIREHYTTRSERPRRSSAAGSRRALITRLKNATSAPVSPWTLHALHATSYIGSRAQISAEEDNHRRHAFCLQILVWTRAT